MDQSQSALKRRRAVLERERIDLVLDVGAHVGQYPRTLRFGGYEGRIVSFEPLESAYGDIPLAIHYDVLEEQSKDFAERRDTAARLKSGLATVGGLEPAELASAVSLVDRYGQGATLSEGDLQNLEFVRKLVDGSIDLKMYRAGVAKGPPMATPAQLGMAPQKKSIWTKINWFFGVVVLSALFAMIFAGQP